MSIPARYCLQQLSVKIDAGPGLFMISNLLRTQLDLRGHEPEEIPGGEDTFHFDE